MDWLSRLVGFVLKQMRHNNILVESIEHHESYREFPYDDATGKRVYPNRSVIGKLTIGIGTLIEHYRNDPIIIAVFYAGVSRATAIILMEIELDKVSRATAKLDWFNGIPTGVQNVVIEMCYQMGTGILSTYKNFVRALRSGQYELASQEMLYNKVNYDALNNPKDKTYWSKWHRQTKNRCEDLASIIASFQV